MSKDLTIILDGKPDLNRLVQIIDYIKPSKLKDGDIEGSVQRITTLQKHLEENPGILIVWSTFLHDLLASYNPGYLYRERSFFGNTNLFAKFWKLINLKFLPKSIPPNEMDKLLDVIFQAKQDYKWVKAIDNRHWADLFKLLSLKDLFIKYPKAVDKLKQSIVHISYRITALGMDSDILNKIPVLNDQNSPFLVQNRKIMLAFEEEKSHGISSISQEKLDQLFGYLAACKKQIIELRENKRTLGISMHLTYISKRLIQQIDRISLLLRLHYYNEDDAFYIDFTTLFKEMLEYQEVKNSIRKLMKESVNLVAFEIVEHTAQKGEKYIAGTSKEYWKFLTKSMLGGFLIAIFASFKILMDKMDVSPLGEGLLFGVNYAVCFVLVYIMGGIIATKQPAMTSSSIVQSIDRCTEESVDSIKNLLIKVSRSQFISFVGNLILAFPMAMLISWSFPDITNNMLLDNYKATSLMQDINPIESGAWYYAAIAGIILSVSGLISGYFDNKVIYGNIADRIIHLPALEKRMSTNIRKKIAGYVLRNSGSLAGNISLGFMLGLTGSIGFFAGLPLDIRHVAFSSANLGFAMEYVSFDLAFNIIILLFIGVLGIGLINFLVSFGVTFWIAWRSRNATFGLFKKLIFALAKHFIRRPHHFFLPVKLK